MLQLEIVVIQIISPDKSALGTLMVFEVVVNRLPSQLLLQKYNRLELLAFFPHRKTPSVTTPLREHQDKDVSHEAEPTVQLNPLGQAKPEANQPSPPPASSSFHTGTIDDQTPSPRTRESRAAATWPAINK